MQTKLLVPAAVIGLLLAAMPARAHHAFAAEFDANKQVTLRGTITKMEWINPHAWLHVDVKGPDGKTVNWAIELGPPNSLIKRGWTKTSVPAGVEIFVVGYQSKDGANRANGRDITLPNGTKLFAGSSGTGAPYEIPVK
ncbi:MAG TPA: DUF6152 family protein [Terriglobia bacterium]|nr:DUF6152 family protein [Terriglobia bacterium]